MNYVKISEKITELDTLFKSPTPQTSFQNSLLSFEISKMEMIKKKTDDEKADETPKSYFLKKLTFKSSENLTFFESFLGKFLDHLLPGGQRGGQIEIALLRLPQLAVE